jgi:hypothetical protein
MEPPLDPIFRSPKQKRPGQFPAASFFIRANWIEGLLLLEKVRDLLPGFFRVVHGYLGAFFRSLAHGLA